MICPFACIVDLVDQLDAGPPRCFFSDVQLGIQLTSSGVDRRLPFALTRRFPRPGPRSFPNPRAWRGC
jgi:hypothetical protein